MENKGYTASPPAYPVTISPSPRAVVLPPPRFGETPMQVTCGNCHQTVLTTTATVTGACAYIAVIVTLLLCFPCFWVPLVIDSCKDVDHTCPACNALLGQYKKI